MIFCHFCIQEQFFMSSYLLSWPQIGPTLKGSKFFSARPNEMGGKNENRRVASPESVTIQLNGSKFT